MGFTTNRPIEELIHARDLLVSESAGKVVTDARVFARLRDQRESHGGFSMLGQRPDESLVDFIRRWKRERRK